MRIVACAKCTFVATSNAICTVFESLTLRKKPDDRAVRDFETIDCRNRRSVGPPLAKSREMTRKADGKKRALAFDDFIAAAYPSRSARGERTCGDWETTAIHRAFCMIC